MAFTRVTVIRTYQTPNGNPARGVVTFTPTVPMVNELTVVAKSMPAPLNANGTISIALEANTDPATLPVGATYTVVEEITGTPVRQYIVSIPHNLGSPVDLATLEPLTPIPPSPEATWIAALAAKQAADGDLTALANLGDGVPVRTAGTWAAEDPGTFGGGVTDHGALTGLSDDDHPQYHNNTRGDARYSQLGHNHSGTYAELVHTHAQSDVTSLVTALAGKQPLDADLTALAGLGDGVPVRTAGTWAAQDPGTFGGSYTDEQVRDVIGAALVAGSNITITPNDGADTITIAATGGSSYTDEQVRDVMGAALVAGSNITITPNDGADTITIAASGSTASNVIPVINVKDSPYNATGNGSTNDTTAIQAALDAVPTGGGIVFFPAGDYRVTAMLTVTKHGTVLRGVGSGTHAGSSQDTRMSRIRANGTLSGNPMLRVQATANTAPLYGCMIEDLSLDGNDVATGHGLHWRSYQSHLNRVHIDRFPSGRGLWLQGYAGVWDLYESIYSQVEVSECAVGIYNDAGATDMHFTQCVIFHNDINVHAIDGASQQFTACHFYYSKVGDNLRIENAFSRTKFVNCKIESATQHVINIDTALGGMSDLQFIGCNFAGGEHSTNNTYDVFRVSAASGSACSRLMIVGCTFTAYGNPTNKPRYMLNLDGNGVHNALVVGCIFNAGDAVTGMINNNANQGATLAPVIRDNGGDGYISRRTGTATVTSGNTSVSVTHGVVGVTPANIHVKVTPTNSMGNATKFWVTSVGATTFTINVNTDPGATTATFAWEVDV